LDFDLGEVMAAITLKDVIVDFPIYNASSRSLKQRVIGAATGGRLAADATGRVIVRALDGVSIGFRDGDRIGLMGHNGSGKSTLLRVLSGAYTPTSGTAVIEGSVGSLIDISLGIDPEATGRENIFIRGALLGMKRAEIETYARELIEFTGLGNFIDMPLRTYSSGMQMRLAFAISTVIRPGILLMDEWLSSADEEFKPKIEKRMGELLGNSSILVIASHSSELLLEVCNRVIWLKQGRVEADGATNEIVARYFDQGLVAA
jgi:lipopolysaccharide transport system ATP-binding protein